MCPGLPTGHCRDVYVTRDESGDREFAGFGLPTTDYCDCFINAEHLPLGVIAGADYVVTGTLGLAYPETRGAMNMAVDIARGSGR
jgi:fructokinase